MPKRVLIIFAVSAFVAFAFGVGATIVHLSNANHALVIRVAKDEQKLEANIESQVPNRVENVKHWCGEFDIVLGYLRDRANDRRKIDPTVKPFALPPLDCRGIEAKTAASAAAPVRK